jgi:hypothetical protein
MAHHGPLVTCLGSEGGGVNFGPASLHLGYASTLAPASLRRVKSGDFPNPPWPGGLGAGCRRRVLLREMSRPDIEDRTSTTGSGPHAASAKARRCRCAVCPVMALSLRGRAAWSAGRPIRQ